MSPRDPHRDAGIPPERPEDGSVTRPSRDDATAAGRMEELRTGTARDQSGGGSRHAKPRRDPEATAHAGERERPHVTENDEDAPVQDEVESPGDVPVLPANASGTDQSRAADHPRKVSDESAYENRPEEDKDWEP